MQLYSLISPVKFPVNFRFVFVFHVMTNQMLFANVK